LDGRKIKRERSYHIFYSSLELNLPLLDKMYKEIIDPPENLKLLRNQIVEADGYMPITPEYNHSTSAALNTLDSFLVILDIFYNYRQVI
jgi:NAD(P)H-dependent FMN reductase